MAQRAPAAKALLSVSGARRPSHGLGGKTVVYGTLRREGCEEVWGSGSLGDGFIPVLARSVCREQNNGFLVNAPLRIWAFVASP